MRLGIVCLSLLLLWNGCSKNSPEGIWVDLNGTCRTPLVLYRWVDSLQPFDTARLRSDGVYLFQQKLLEYGYYRIGIDSVHGIDLIVHTDSLIKVNGRVGYLEETTFSGTHETRVWNQLKMVSRELEKGLNQLQVKMISPLSPTLSLVQKDSLFGLMEQMRTQYRNLSDSVLQHSSSGWVMMAYINSSAGNYSLWNVFDDYTIIYQNVANLRQAYPHNLQVAALMNRLEQVSAQMAVYRLLSPGQKFLNLSMTSAEGELWSLGRYIGRRVIFAVHDPFPSESYKKFKLREMELLRWKAKGYTLIAAASDTIADKTGWIERPLSYPVAVLDSIGRVTLKGVDKPLVVWLDEQGIIQAVNLSEAAAGEWFSHIQ